MNRQDAIDAKKKEVSYPSPLAGGLGGEAVGLPVRYQSERHSEVRIDGR
jgi:transcription elongation GreA/GreB family factor